MAVERAYWSVRNTFERTVGGAISGIGNRLALSGHEKIGKPLIEKGIMMQTLASIPHERFRIDPTILNEDGSLNHQAFREKLKRMGEEHKAEDQAYFFTPEWQADERQADEDIKAGRVTKFPSAEEAIQSLSPNVTDKITGSSDHPTK